MFDKPKYKVTVSSKTEFDENFKKKFVFVPYNIIYADDVKYLPNGIEIHTHTENMRDNIRTEYSAFVPKKYVEKIEDAMSKAPIPTKRRKGYNDDFNVAAVSCIQHFKKLLIALLRFSSQSYIHIGFC